MRSRTLREGTVGLLMLVGLGIFGGTILWLRGLNPANRSYKVIIEFNNIAGMQVGATVQYRGVKVGRVTAIRPGPNRVEVETEIAPADLVIPKDVSVQANSSGLIGEVTIEITPQRPLTAEVAAKPLDRNCDRALIVCDGSRLAGMLGISSEEVLNAFVRFTTTYTDPKFFDNVNSVLKNSAKATAGIAALTQESTLLARETRQNVGAVVGSVEALGQAANQVSLTVGKAGTTVDQVNGLIASNRSTLVATLDNLSATSAQLKTTLGSLGAIANQAEQGPLLQNLESLTANAAQASANLRDISQAFNDPANLVTLQKTLDSARATFENTQKLTSDLDELLGDPKLRDNLRKLINGLSNLLSSTQQLEQQTQVAWNLEQQRAALPNPALPASPPLPQPSFSPRALPTSPEASPLKVNSTP